MKKKIGSKVVRCSIIAAMSVMLMSNSVMTAMAEDAVPVVSLEQETEPQVQEKESTDSSVQNKETPEAGTEAGQSASETTGEQVIVTQTQTQTQNSQKDAVEGVLQEKTDNGEVTSYSAVMLTLSGLGGVAAANDTNDTNGTNDTKTVEDVQDALTDITKEDGYADQVVEIKEKVEEISDAVEKTPVITDGILDKAEELKDDFMEDLEKQNTEISNTTEEVNASIVVETEEQKADIVYQYTDEEANVVNTTLIEYVAQQAEQAKQAAEDAQQQLEAALDPSQDALEATETVKACAEAAAQAATLAAQAKENAEKAYEDAQKALIESIKKYNAYAEAYGYDVIVWDDGTTPKYTEEELAQLGIVAVDTDLSKLEEELQKQETVIETAKEKVDEAYTDCLDVIEKAQETLDAAKTVAGLVDESNKDAVQTELDKAEEQIEAPAREAMKTIITTQEELPEEVQAAKENVTEAKAELAGIMQEIEKSKPDLSQLLQAIKDKKEVFVKVQVEIKASMEIINASQASAKNSADWANALVSANDVRIYGQKDKENPDAVTTTNTDYDLSDDSVASRDTSMFNEVTIKDTSVTVPYSVMRAYIQKMYALPNTTYEGITENNEQAGKGISIGDGTPNSGSMLESCWTLNADGKIDENSICYYKGEDGIYRDINGNVMASGTYFKGYSFKHEKDGYHVDGILYAYEQPGTEPGPGPTPEPTPEPTNPPEPEPTTGGGGDITTNTILPQLTAFAASAGDTVTLNEGEVPLAGSLTGIDNESTPLADAVPQTGDETRRGIPFAAAGVAALGAAFIANLKMRRKQK